MPTHKPKQMTEREAWLYLAKKWDRPREGSGIAYITHHGYRYNYGLCSSLSVLSWQCLVDVSTGYRMRGKLNTAGRGQGDGYFWPTTRAGARKRAAFCRRMARECAKEPTK